MTHAQLGKQAKTLHPGAYDHLKDDHLGKAIAKRYPGLYQVDSGKDMDSGTIPETPKTLQIQLNQLAEGKRRCVFVARGSNLKIDPKQYGAQKQSTPAGDFYFNPQLIKRAEIVAALKEHRLNEILGTVDSGYGAPPKEELQSPVHAVVARDAEGETAHGALTDEEHAPPAIAAAQELTPAGGRVSVEPPEKEIAHRIKKFKQPAGKKWPKYHPAA